MLWSPNFCLLLWIKTLQSYFLLLLLSNRWACFLNLLSSLTYMMMISHPFLVTCAFESVCRSFGVSKSNQALNLQSRIHRDRRTQTYQCSHWYMKDHSGRRECVSGRKPLNVLEWVCVCVCERTRFTRTNQLHVESEMSFRQLSMRSWPLIFSMTCQHQTHFSCC